MKFNSMENLIIEIALIKHNLMAVLECMES